MSRRAGRFPTQLVMLAVCALTVPAQLYVAIPLSPRLGDEGAGAWAGSAFSLAYALGFLVFGPLSDRLGRRRVIVWGLAALALTTAAAAAAPLPGWFLLARAAQGLAAATFAPVALVWVTEKAPPGRRAAALAVLTTALIGAGLAGQLYGTAIIAVWDWRWSFVFAAGLYAFLAMLLGSGLEPDSPHVPATLHAVYRPLSRLLRTPATVSVFVAALTVFGSFVVLYSTLDTYLVEMEGFSPGEVLGAQAAGCLGLVAALAVRTVLRGSLTARRQVLIGFGTAAAGTLVTQADVTGWLLPVLGSIVYVAGIGLVVPGLVDLLARRVPDARAVAVAFNTFMLFVGAAVAPIITADLPRRTALLLLAAALVTAAAIVAAGAASRSLPPQHASGRPARATRSAPPKHAARRLGATGTVPVLISSQPRA
jgi:MFS family permease